MLEWINNNLHKKKTDQKVLPSSTHTITTDNFKNRNIAGQILELEFQCESETSSAELISELTLLYMKAVGYYESINDQRYRLYQKRLQAFLKKQNIDEVLKGKSGKLASKKDITEKEIISARIKSRGEVAQIIERSEKLEKINRIKIYKNLSQQQDQLSKRIHKRRTISNCSILTKDDEGQIQDIKLEVIQDNRPHIMYELLPKRQSNVKRVFI